MKHNHYYSGCALHSPFSAISLVEEPKKPILSDGLPGRDILDKLQKYFITRLSD